MALSLTAEQKKILNILKIDEQYVIPAYQRPYSWEYEHCFQLYNDLIEAFKSKEDYFIGNLIIAKSENDEYELDVVDGQQRLTTLFLMIKVLSIFTKDELFKNDFEKILGGINRSTRKYEYRIKTKVFETDDENMFEEVLKYTEQDFEKVLEECSNKKGEFQEKKCINKFKKNIMFFYNWFSFFHEQNENNLDDFINFFLEKVYLLPIELRGKTKDEANEKALVIFETINNRGMNLEDADIFKAKLYKRAKNIGEEKIFIDLWISFKNSCENLKVDIDDVFRYYSHIVRGQNNITSNEINLREFFTMKNYSPFQLKKYKVVMDDLNKIVDILEFINQERQQETEFSKWLQLVEAYTNQYPKLALVTYVFTHGYDDTKLMNYFLESLIRYVYYRGSTTTVKFEIYNIIKKVSNNQLIDNYYIETTISDFDYLGGLKYGYALLSFYSNKQVALEKYYIDKIVNLKDKNILNWDEEKLEKFTNSLGNYIVLDMPKKNLSLAKKLEYYKHSDIQEIQKTMDTLLSLDYQDFQKRDNLMKNNLVNFFKGN